ACFSVEKCYVVNCMTRCFNDFPFGILGLKRVSKWFSFKRFAFAPKEFSIQWVICFFHAIFSFDITHIKWDVAFFLQVCCSASMVFMKMGNCYLVNIKLVEEGCELFF